MQLIKHLYNFIFPPTCTLCKQASKRELELCFACEKNLPFMTFNCTRCAEPLPPTSVNNLTCGSCLKNPPPFDQIKSLFLYQEPIDQWIMQLKFHENLTYAHTFGTLMSNYFGNGNYDFNCIIPVPLHRSRLKQRGFNQALEIARPISKALHIPLEFKSCIRIKNTDAQSQLSFDARTSNIKKAFAVNKKFKAKSVLVIDDVMTTGNTLQEFCKTLKQNGVEWITVWVCARTVLR